MATTPKPWPQNAIRARNQAAERVQDAIRVLSPLVYEKRTFTRGEILLRAFRALNSCQIAVQWLMDAGAPVVPFEDGAPMAMDQEQE